MSKIKTRTIVLAIIALLLLYATRPEICNSSRTDMPSICAD